MREQTKAAAFLGAWLLIAATAEAWAEPIAQAVDPIWGVSAPVMMTSADVTPVIQVVSPPVPSEVPEEDALITSALLEQGYYSDAVPLDYLHQDCLRSACERYGVPCPLALAVIEVESGFDAEAVGVDGHDIGLFQIRTSNHQWIAQETGSDPMTPAGNIECGVWLLGYLLGEYGSTDAALTAYRWGEDNGTRDYARTVLAAAERWAGTLK